MNTRADPYVVLGVARGASDAQIHAAYRAAVRRTHPDAGGDAAAFEAVQQAYEVLRDPARRAVPDAEPVRKPARPSAAGADDAGSRLEDLLAESRRLEDEARRLAGMPPRHGAAEPAQDATGDSLAAILRDAGQQLHDVADDGVRELRRRIRRML